MTAAIAMRRRSQRAHRSQEFLLTGSQWVLLSAVAFGALKGCLPRLGKAVNDSPTLLAGYNRAA